ncbi:MAG: serine/threonine protein kinase [Polyangiaceae bacterium]|nr:serine/threonine protein kinase [Polyangiaceae bacterium]
MANNNAPQPFVRKVGSILRTLGEPKFKILDVLGVGGMATTYKALDLGTQKLVAVKELHPRFRDQPELIDNEACVLGRLRHPGIVEVYQKNRSLEGNPFIVMELLEGVTVFEALRTKGKFALVEALGIIIQLLYIVSHVHQADGVHSDIKAANVYLHKPLEMMPTIVKLFDFGILKRIDAAERTRHFAGTWIIAAPEQLRGDPLGPAADIYSLGIMFIEMVTGAIPFADYGSSYENMLMTMDFEVPSLTRFGVPPEIAKIISWMVEKDLKKRANDAMVLAVALRAIWRTMSPSEDPCSIATDERMTLLAAKQPPITEGTFAASTVPSPEILELMQKALEVHQREQQSDDVVRDTIPDARNQALDSYRVPVPNPALPPTTPDSPHARNRQQANDANQASSNDEGNALLSPRSGTLRMSPPNQPPPSQPLAQPPAPVQLSPRSGTLRIDQQPPSQPQPRQFPQASHIQPVPSRLSPMPWGVSQVCTVPPQELAPSEEPSQSTHHSMATASQPALPSMGKRIWSRISPGMREVWASRAFRVILALDGLLAVVLIAWFLFLRPSTEPATPAPRLVESAVSLSASAVLPPAPPAVLPLASVAVPSVAPPAPSAPPPAKPIVRAAPPQQPRPRPVPSASAPVARYAFEEGYDKPPRPRPVPSPPPSASAPVSKYAHLYEDRKDDGPPNPRLAPSPSPPPSASVPSGMRFFKDRRDAPPRPVPSPSPPPTPTALRDTLSEP